MESAQAALTVHDPPYLSVADHHPEKVGHGCDVM